MVDHAPQSDSRTPAATPATAHEAQTLRLLVGELCQEVRLLREQQRQMDTMIRRLHHAATRSPGPQALSGTAARILPATRPTPQPVARGGAEPQPTSGAAPVEPAVESVSPSQGHAGKTLAVAALILLLPIVGALCYHSWRTLHSTQAIMNELKAAPAAAPNEAARAGGQPGLAATR